MKYLKDFDYIIENMSQARKILKDNDISKEDERFKKIIDKTNRDGYTGFITKLVFEMAMEVDSALRFYEDLKEQSIDVGSPEIKRILDSNQGNSQKIQQIVEIIRKKRDKTDYDLIFESNGYNVYQIHNYEGIMCTGSPAWCLKTKSMFDQYTKRRQGTQFVAIDKRDIGEKGEINLTVPNTWDGVRYSNNDFRYIRYGITIFPSGSMEVYDDDNKQVHVSIIDGKVDSRNVLPGFIERILNELHKYWEDKIKPNVKVGPVEGFDDLIDKMDPAVENHKSSFSDMVAKNRDTGEWYDEFIKEVLALFNVNTKRELFDLMNDYTDSILSSNYFMENCGVLDILVNEFIASSGEFPQLEEYPGITKREIPLGGYFFNEQETGDLAIKYHYGYQYDKYGKAALLQGFGTLENYYNHLADNFYNIIYDDFQYTGIGFLSDNFDMGDTINRAKSIPDKEKYKDGYKVTLDIDKISEYNISDKSPKELAESLTDELQPWFKGTKREGNKVIIPICSNPLEKEDETQS